MGEILVRKRTLKSGFVWEYRFEAASINGTRKWITKSGFHTKKSALLAGQEAFNSYMKYGIPALPAEISFSDLLDLYVKNAANINCVDSTIKGYEKKIRLYIKPKLGQYKITSISRQNIINFLDDMYNKGFSMNTISSCKGIITGAFNYAIDNHLIFLSPAAHIKPLRKGGRPPKIPTRYDPHIYVPKQKMEMIFERFPEGTVDHLALMLGYHCGLRLGETFALTWDDINFESKSLQINRQIQWKSAKENSKESGFSETGYWYFCAPKYDSYRTISLDDDIFGLLCREKKKQERAQIYYDENYTNYYINVPLILGGQKPRSKQINTKISSSGRFKVNFVNVRDNGTYITPRTLQHTSSVIHHKMDYPEWDYHSLRHTHATMLIENGAPAMYVKTRLGHAQVDTTMNIYANHITEKITSDGDAVLNIIF